jgi:hypothetical protein
MHALPRLRVERAQMPSIRRRFRAIATAPCLLFARRMASLPRADRLALLSMLVLAVTACSAGNDGPKGAAGPVGTVQGPTGPVGPTGATGATGPKGPIGEPTGTVLGIVKSTATGKPLGNVAIAGVPGKLSATTAADGTFSISDVYYGAYSLTFKRTGYVDKIVSIEEAPTGPTNVAVSMDSDPSSDGPTIVVSDNLTAGFAQAVTIKPSVTDSDSDVSKLVYAWTQVSGAPATIAGASTSSIAFTTLAFTDAKPGLVGRFGGLGFDTDETGNYAFRLTATDPEGHATSVTVHVSATTPSTSLGNVPLGLPAWFQGDGVPQATWSWTLDTSLVQGGSQSKLAGATTQFPSFTPDKPGTYKLTESVSGKTLVVHGGTWLGIIGTYQGCQSCHNGTTAPDKFTPWLGTAHASTLQRGLDGQFGPDFSPACLGCHSVGSTTAASNGGFADVMKKDAWPWPATLKAGNWNALVQSKPDLAQLGSVQCESCHGPQSSDAHPFDHTARISWSEEVCASCHQASPFNYKPSQWQTSKHADQSLPQRVGTVEARPGGGSAHCGRCHTAQGYSHYVKQLAIGYTGNLTKDGQPLAADKSNAADDTWLASIGLTAATVQPQVCAACHDPHDATNPSQLRLYDAIPALPNGQSQLASVGKGAVCMACHNSRNGEADDFVPAPAAITGPHDGPQTDVMFGVNAYFMPRFTPSPHLAVKDTCVGCHAAIPTASQSGAHQTSNHSFAADLTICAACHGPNGGTLVDGVAMQAQVQAQLDALDALVYQKVQSALAGAVTKYGSYKVRIVDPATGYTSSWVASGTAPSNVALSAAPVTIGRPQPVPQHGGLSTLVLTMAAPVSFEAYDSTGADKGPLSLTTFNVTLSGVLANGAALLPGSSIVAKAIWNEQLLHNDGTLGVHNLPFFNGVINNTSAQLRTLP